jgi:hypothetical protein
MSLKIEIIEPKDARLVTYVTGIAYFLGEAPNHAPKNTSFEEPEINGDGSQATIKDPWMRRIDVLHPDDNTCRSFGLVQAGDSNVMILNSKGTSGIFQGESVIIEQNGVIVEFTPLPTNGG